MSEMFKEKIRTEFYQLVWVFVVAFAIHKIQPLVWKKGEFVGLSIEQMLEWVFGLRSTLYFLVIFLIPFIVSLYLLIRIKSTTINILWSLLVSWYITVFIYPGYYSNYFDSFGGWSDVIEYSVLLVFPAAVLYLLKKKKEKGLE